MKLYGGVRFIDAPCPANVRRLDTNALPWVDAAHRNGIRVDLPYLRHLESDFTSRQEEIESSIFSSIGPYQDFDGKKLQPFNISSPDQVARLLFTHLRLHGSDHLQLTPSEHRPIANDEVLEKYRDKHACVGLILDHRELNKLLGTYIRPLQRHADSSSRVHTRFSVTTAATGRLSSLTPNLQNIPVRGLLGKLIRAAFISSPGSVLVSCDLSQIEMRWAAHLAQDPVMMQVFIDNEDIHDRTACNIFRRSLEEISAIKKKVKNGAATTAEESIYKYFTQFERLPSKTIGFGVLYGQTAQGLLDSILQSMDPQWSSEERAKFLAYWTLPKCEQLIIDWYTVYARIKAWMELQFARARRHGMTWDAFGRMRLVPEVYSVHNRIKQEGLRKSGNHAIQASAQGTIKLAMAELTPISSFFNTSPGICWPLLQVHDELINEVDKYQARDYADVSREIMENASPLSIPVKSSSDIAERWSDLK